MEKASKQRGILIAPLKRDLSLWQVQEHDGSGFYRDVSGEEVPFGDAIRIAKRHRASLGLSVWLQDLDGELWLLLPPGAIVPPNPPGQPELKKKAQQRSRDKRSKTKKPPRR